MTRAALVWRNLLRRPARTALTATGVGLGVANTMAMSVFERIREIGILRAVGWCRPRIAGMILSRRWGS